MSCAVRGDHRRTGGKGRRNGMLLKAYNSYLCERQGQTPCIWAAVRFSLGPIRVKTLKVTFLPYFYVKYLHIRYCFLYCSSCIMSWLSTKKRKASYSSQIMLKETVL